VCDTGEDWEFLSHGRLLEGGDAVPDEVEGDDAERCQQALAPSRAQLGEHVCKGVVLWTFLVGVGVKGHDDELLLVLLLLLLVLLLLLPEESHVCSVGLFGGKESFRARS